MLKVVLLSCAVSSLIGCASLPEFPEIEQCGVKSKDVSKPGFYCVNNKTQARKFKKFDDPSMDGAQAVSAKDYEKSEAWIREIEKLAYRRCQ